MSSISVLIKPTNACNMRCVYCFHRNLGYAENQLSEASLKKFFVLLAKKFTHINVVWHGGEPTCVGLEQFKKYIDIEKEVGKTFNVTFKNSIQSNLLNINDRWLEFLSANDIHLSSSFDGVVNSLTRKNTELFFQKRDLCKKFGFEVGVICVVTSLNINSLIESYELFKSKKIPVNFNPYITADTNDPLYVDINIYKEKMLQFFDYWVHDMNCNINVNPFKYYLNAYFRHQLGVCVLSSCLASWMCLEPDGRIVPCDKTFPDCYCYGNLDSIKSIDEVYESSGFTMLIEKAIARRSSCKEKCEWFQYCNGGCNHDALVGGDISKNNHYYCQIYQALFEYIKTKIAPIKFTDNINPFLQPFIYELQHGERPITTYHDVSEKNFYDFIEPGIKNTVFMLNNANYRTVSSCEGHAGTGFYKTRCVTVRIDNNLLRKFLSVVFIINKEYDFKKPVTFHVLDIPSDSTKKDVRISFGDIEDEETVKKQELFNQSFCTTMKLGNEYGMDELRIFESLTGHTNIWI